MIFEIESDVNEAKPSAKKTVKHKGEDDVLNAMRGVDITRNIIDSQTILASRGSIERLYPDEIDTQIVALIVESHARTVSVCAAIDAAQDIDSLNAVMEGYGWTCQQKTEPPETQPPVE